MKHGRVCGMGKMRNAVDEMRNESDWFTRQTTAVTQFIACRAWLARLLDISLTGCFSEIRFSDKKFS